MPKINKHLDEIYECPEEKIPESVKPKIDNELMIWYDNLKVNPLLTYFTVDDIRMINEISSSVSLNNNPKEKYRRIGSIMESRGFKFVGGGGGTNRRAYVCTYDTRIVAKVGTDKVGFSNNLREYVNQDVLKPFCCKIFEVTPCGTLAIIERVYPIKSIDEFQSVGEDIFNVLYFKVRSKDIAMEDIGFRSYQNWGIRDNFGPVLLDYPTMYVADPKKCFCNQRDAYGNYCNAPLDYDTGFDNIICTKCGHRYLSKSIAKKNGDSITELIYAAGNKFNSKKGECKMKISFIGKNGQVIEKDLNNGKSDYVKKNNVAYSAPDSSVMPDDHYKKTFGHSRHNLGVTFTKRTLQEIKEEKIEEESKVVNNIPYSLDPDVLFDQMNGLTNIHNSEISEIWMDHLDEVYHEVYDAVPSVDTTKGLNSMDEYKGMFKLVIGSIDKADEFYGKIVEYLHETRKLSLLSDDSYKLSPSIEIDDDLTFDKFYNGNMILTYLERVKAALRIVPNMGFKSEIMSGPNVLDTILDTVYDPEVIPEEFVIGMIIINDEPWYYPCVKSITEPEEEPVEIIDDTNSIIDIDSYAEIEEEVEDDHKDDDIVNIDPEKAIAIDKYNKKKRRGKGKNKNKKYNDDYNDMRGEY